jgi:hypothetical protein
MKLPTKKQIDTHLKAGFCICHGHAIRITKRQSAGRRLRELIEDDKENHFYFMAKPNDKNGAPYKVFFKKGAKSKIYPIKTPKENWQLMGYISSRKIAKSKEFKTLKECLNYIKCCTCN